MPRREEEAYVQLYTGHSIEFVSDSTQGRVAEKLREAFVTHFLHEPAQSEVRSWQNSLRAMSNVLTAGDLLDHGVIVEWQLPLTSKRLDCLITGRGPGSRPNAVIVELKQWDDVGRSHVSDCVTTFLGGRERDVLHPSRQVGQYHRYLLDTHTAFSTASIGLQACAYAHNLRFDPSTPLFDAQWEDLLRQYPLFAADRSDELADLLVHSLGDGSGVDVLERVLEGRYKPHKRLLDHTAAVIRNEPTYVLLDEQLVVFETILSRVRARSLSTERSTFVVRGGPGTGKSVVALNLVGALSGLGLVTHHATGSKAFTTNLRKVVGTRAGAMFKYFNSYMDLEGASLDVLVCDEAHRIRDTSNNRFTPRDKRSTVPQVDELIKAAKVSVFFVDDLQIVRPGEIGSGQLIVDAARRLGAAVVELELEAQFRCNGSDAYLRWVDTTLDVRRTPQVLWDAADPFDFEIVDTVEELDALIRARAASGATARLSAGYCWTWSDPKKDGTLVDDVVIGGWSMPWNAREGKGRLAKGIPPSDRWAHDPGGLEQVGCVYTAQGFEYDYAGVIWGRDLVHRGRDGWVGQPSYNRDSVLKRERDPQRFAALVKHTYRVLLTRGLLGCAVFFEDEQTRDFVTSRVDWSRS
jgi:DUF2075 family protein